MRTLKERIRLWLLVHPRAVSLRLTTGGKQSTVAIAANQSWAQIAGSVEAMAPDLIETLDANGNVGRACRPADFDDSDEDQAETTPAPATLVLDGESARFTLVANLLAQAHQKSFDALIELANANARRAEALERTAATYERNRQRDLDDREDRIIEKEEVAEQNPLQQLAGAVMGGMGMAQNVVPTQPTKPNGKA